MLGLGVSTLCSQKSEYNLEMAIRIPGFCVCGPLSMDLTHLGLCSALVPVTENNYVCACSVAQSCVILWTPWITVHQAPLSLGLSQQKYLPAQG